MNRVPSAYRRDESQRLIRKKYALADTRENIKGKCKSTMNKKCEKCVIEMET
jgi:hypothetical protein